MTKRLTPHARRQNDPQSKAAETKHNRNFREEPIYKLLKAAVQGSKQLITEPGGLVSPVLLEHAAWNSQGDSFGAPNPQ